MTRGRPILAIPGPSTVPDRVLRAMHRAAENIYEGPLIDLSHSLFPDLRRVAGQGEGEAFIYASNGHGVWEAALFNLFSPGDRLLVLESGRFAVGWGAMAAKMGVGVEVLNAPARRGVDPQAVEDRLRRDDAREIDAILVVQVDTASGVWNDVAAIRAALDAAGHPALLLVDCIACLGCIPFEMEAWGVDAMVTGSQKGLMTPPGLGIAFAGPRAMERHRRNGCLSSYWDWTPRADPERYYQIFCGTAPVQLLYGLREALDMLAEEGLEAVFARHRRLAGAVRAAVGRWAEGGALAFAVEDAPARSDVVTTILTEGGEADAIRARAEAEAEVTLGLGIGFGDGAAFRIGHMGHLNEPTVLGTLAAVEMALRAEGVAHGTGGVEAALDALGG